MTIELCLSPELEHISYSAREIWICDLFSVLNGNNGSLLIIRGRKHLRDIEILGTRKDLTTFNNLVGDEVRIQFLWCSMLRAPGATDKISNVMSEIFERGKIAGRNEIRQKLYELVVLEHEY